MDKLKKLLQQATEEEIKGLAKILVSQSPTPDPIVEASWWNCQSVFGYLIGKSPSYKDIVRQVADKLKVNYKRFHSTREIEIKIAQKVLETIWEKMTPEQREEMEEELKRTALKFDKKGSLVKSASIFTALTAARLSGFGVYLLASTALGAITSTLGFTLPFAIYATISSAISVIIGPVGWLGAGLFAIWKLTAPNYRRLISAILYISLLRSKF